MLRMTSRAWVAIVEGVDGKIFAEFGSTICFRDAEYSNGYVSVQTSGETTVQLITVIHYAKNKDEENGRKVHVYIRSFLTHKEYNDPPYVKNGDLGSLVQNEYSSSADPAKNDCEGRSPHVIHNDKRTGSVYKRPLN